MANSLGQYRWKRDPLAGFVYEYYRGEGAPAQNWRPPFSLSMFIASPRLDYTGGVRMLGVREGRGCDLTAPTVRGESFYTEWAATSRPPLVEAHSVSELVIQ